MFKPDECLLISTEKKQLPFRAAKYWNQKVFTDYESLKLYLKDELVDDEKIKVVCFDSFTRLITLVGTYLRTVKKITGYTFWEWYGIILDSVLGLLQDIHAKYVFMTAITDIAYNSDGDEVRQVKVDGRLKGLIESYFTITLFTYVDMEKSLNERYQLCTNSDGKNTAKSPMGMFKKQYIPNDVVYIINKMNEYYDINNSDIEVSKPITLIAGRSGTGKSTSFRNLITIPKANGKTK